MKYTYDLNENGVLILFADQKYRDWLRDEVRGPLGENGETGRGYLSIESDALEPMLGNWELETVFPYETGDLTDAPMLGLRNENGEITARWAFMDYAVRSFVDDLIDTGKAVFVS